MQLAVAQCMQATRFRRVVSRRARRGFSLLEIIVAIAIIAMVSAGVTVAIMKQKKAADIKLTATNAGTIRMGIKAWWIDHDSSTCPTVPTLIADGAIDKSKSTKADAWDQPWIIKCEDYDVTVVSKGPDKLPDTEDDIRVPAT
jgi:prepilin-type N-terminal cleavage/methylation domain-containing protein